MKILLLCDQYPLPPRIINMRNSIKNLIPDAHIDIFAWNRNNVEVIDCNVITLNMEIGYGNQFKKLINLPYVLKFIKNIIYIGRYDVLHSVDLEMMLLAAMVKKKSKLIYEVYDIKFFSRRLLDFGRSTVEKYFIRKKVDSMILASPYFEIYYSQILKKLPNKIVINNKPLYHKNFDQNSEFMRPYRDRLTDKTVISFIGLLRYPVIIRNLMMVVSAKRDIILLLAGDGPARRELENYASELKMHNIVFTGRYKSNDLKSIYEVTNIVWAAYPNDDMNVKYAVSNKFFEAQVFQKKIIVSENTLLGDNVIKKGIGQCVDPFSVDNIGTVIENVIKMEYKNTLNSQKFWQDEEKQIGELYSGLFNNKWTAGDSN